LVDNESIIVEFGKSIDVVPGHIYLSVLDSNDSNDYINIYFDNDSEKLYVGEYTTLVDYDLKLDCKLFLIGITPAVSAEFVFSCQEWSINH